MLLTIADTHKWEKSVTTDPFHHFGKNATAKIKSTATKVADAGIVHKVINIDDAFFDWFIPMYESRINSKSNPTVFDIKGKISNQPNKEYFALVVEENGINIGATIFSLKNENLSIAYRTYSNNWNQAKLQAKPSIYTEYLITLIAIKHNCKLIVHGKDRNPYGLNSNIGLAIFKLSVGCQPKKSKVHTQQEIETDQIDTDALILEYPGDSQKDITKAYLLTTPETESKWDQVSKYPHLLEIEVIYRN